MTMRHLLVLALVSGVSVLGAYTLYTADAAAEVWPAAQRMSAETGAEMTRISCRFFADRYPWSVEAVQARRSLHRIVARAGGEGDATVASILADPVLLGGQPYVGPAGALVAAAVLLLIALLQPRSRVRIPGVVLLIAVAGLGIFSYTGAMGSRPAGSSRGAAEEIYAHLPWAAGIAVTLGVILLAIPHRRLVS